MLHGDQRNKKTIFKIKNHSKEGYMRLPYRDIASAYGNTENNSTSNRKKVLVLIGNRMEYSVRIFVFVYRSQHIIVS